MGGSGNELIHASRKASRSFSPSKSEKWLSAKSLNCGASVQAPERQAQPGNGDGIGGPSWVDLGAAQEGLLRFRSGKWGRLEHPRS